MVKHALRSRAAARSVRTENAVESRSLSFITSNESMPADVNSSSGPIFVVQPACWSRCKTAAASIVSGSSGIVSPRVCRAALVVVSAYDGEASY